jgi:hypothetical protein
VPKEWSRAWSGFFAEEELEVGEGEGLGEVFFAEDVFGQGGLFF